MAIESGSRWGVVSTKQARERLAANQLANQCFEVFLPQINKTVVRHGRRLAHRVPLFPGYVFLIVDGDVGRWRSINGTIGVRNLLMQNERPAVVPTDFVDMIRDNCNDEGTFAYHRWLRPGDTAKIVAGPMGNRIGRLVSIDARGRVELLVEMLSSAVPAKMRLDNLIPA